MRIICTLVAFILFLSGTAQVDFQYFQDLEYRMIGPFRAGRTVGAVGIPTQPNVFFVGHNNGGVWKTDDYGRTWHPIFDDAPTGSIGDVAVSPSNPDIIYVGTGEGLHRPDLAVGDGMFKSIDGGKTWRHVGLDDVQQVSRVIVHPKNPDIVFVAGLGHPYGANQMRGVFKSVDGGKNWEKVLYINHNTGAVQVEFDPNNPKTLFASMWEHQEGPWENAKFSGPNSNLYKSTDSGNTWRKITNGLPTYKEGLGRIGVAIAPSNSNRMYATVDAKENGGIYKSDDAGESWILINTDYRLWGRGSDFAEIKVHPKNPNQVFIGNIAAYRSDDVGKSWTSIKGAPGGDDYHRIWINPLQPEIMLFAADQGAVITVNSGKTWSSWYNQPTAQLYHVSTDNQWPYWVYGGQQESGAIGVASRGNGGQITFREFIGVGADEYAYVAVDPKDHNIVYGGRVLQFDKRTGQTQFVGPEVLRSGEIRFLRTMPLIFHPKDDDMLLFGTNVVWKTMNGGQSWEKISPDLTRKRPEVPDSVGDFYSNEMETMPQRAIIYSLGPSHLNRNIIWAGSDDGLVHVTQDGGKTWKDVTPPELKSWDKISQIDAGHFNEGTAYIAVNAIRKDNMAPLVYKTHDFGKTWELITNGMNKNGPVNTVREDHSAPGLLFAGTEREVYFSSDDGANWQSLRLNMPASSIRDLVIKDDDLVIGTHGRSIWIMDNFSPLRELNQLKNKVHLFKPSLATRVRDNMFGDTPLPPEEPTGENPPDGANIDFYLPSDAKKVSLEIWDSKKQLVREYSSTTQMKLPDSTGLPHPTYWIRPKSKLSTEKGHQRFVWNLRYENPKRAKRSYAISAVQYNTPISPKGPFVAPGIYTIRLTVDEKPLEQEITVRMDPRVKSSDADIQLQTDFSLKVYSAYEELVATRIAAQEMFKNKRVNKKVKAVRNKFIGEKDPSEGDQLYGSIYDVPFEDETLVGLQEKLLHTLIVLQASDKRPTEATITAVGQLLDMKDRFVKEWKKLEMNR
ncbi:MAG: WD40/YVTN/BNR-like repeat-containing protein [Croceivirga sp.]